MSWSVTLSPELARRELSMRIHCLMLEMGASPQFSLNKASAIWTLSRKSVPSRRGWIATWRKKSFGEYCKFFLHHIRSQERFKIVYIFRLLRNTFHYLCIKYILVIMAISGVFWKQFIMYFHTYLERFINTFDANRFHAGIFTILFAFSHRQPPSTCFL